jgi:hypothetical protein
MVKIDQTRNYAAIRSSNRRGVPPRAAISRRRASRQRVSALDARHSACQIEGHPRGIAGKVSDETTCRKSY